MGTNGPNSGGYADDGRPESADLGGAGFRPSRRWFVGAGAAGALLAGTSLPMSTALAAVTPAPAAFAINSRLGANVWVGNGAQFRLVVSDADGNVLEQHDAVSPSSILRLRSEHFVVEKITAPSS